MLVSEYPVPGLTYEVHPYVGFCPDCARQVMPERRVVECLGCEAEVELRPAEGAPFSRYHWIGLCEKCATPVALHEGTFPL